MSDVDLHELLAQVEPRLRERYLAVMERLRRRNELANIQRLIDQRRWDEAIAGLDEAAEELSSDFRWAFLLAAGVVEAAVRDVAVNGFAFDLTHWRIQAVFSGMERDLTNLLKGDLRVVVANLAARGGLTARALLESIGLSRSDALALNVFRGSLVDSDRVAGRRRVRELPARRPMTPEARVRMIEGRLATLRAAQVDRVGLWLGQTAVQVAIDQVLRQAVEFGALTKDQFVRIWWTMEDERVRHSHRPMHGQKRALDVPFVSGSNHFLMYPGDARAPASETRGCRCGLTVSFSA